MVQVIRQGDRSGVSVPDYRDLIKTIRQTEPKMMIQLRRDFRKIAKPMVTDIKKEIPSEPPTSGVHVKRPQNVTSGFAPRVIPGRLSWSANSQNRNKSIKAVTVKMPRVKTKFRNGANMTSIARVQVENAAVVMADLAGSSNMWINKRPQTREYRYSRSRSGVRSHKVNNQGRAMINALNRKKSAQRSRFVYPAAEKSMDVVKYQALNVLKGAFDKVNRELRS